MLGPGRRCAWGGRAGARLGLPRSGLPHFARLVAGLGVGVELRGACEGRAVLWPGVGGWGLGRWGCSVGLSKFGVQV